jgi:hypothetical protein
MPAVFRFAPSRCAHIPTRLSTIGEQNLPEAIAQKRRGKLPCENLPLFRSFEDLARLPDHNALPLQYGKELPAFACVSYTLRYRIRCTSFLGFHPHASSFLNASEIPLPVLRMGSSSTLLLEDLSSVVLNVIPINPKATCSRTFFRWKWRHRLWETVVMLHLSCKSVSCKATSHISQSVLGSKEISAHRTL